MFKQNNVLVVAYFLSCLIVLSLSKVQISLLNYRDHVMGVFMYGFRVQPPMWIRPCVKSLNIYENQPKINGAPSLKHKPPRIVFLTTPDHDTLFYFKPLSLSASVHPSSNRFINPPITIHKLIQPNMHIHPFIYPHVHQFIHPAVKPSIHPSVHPLTHRLAHSFTRQSIHRPISLSIHPSIDPPLSSTIHPSANPSFHPPTYQSPSHQLIHPPIS